MTTPVGSTPYPFQASVIRKIVRRLGRTLVTLEMGLGKSLVSILAAREMDAWPTVVVCQASLKWVWQDECQRHAGIRAVVLESMTPPRGGVPRSKVYIVNYRILGPWLPVLRELGPRMIIIDECQAIGHRTQQTRNVREVCKGVPHVLALSGTPLVNRPAELFSTVNILWPKRFPSFWTYAHRYCGMTRKPWGWDHSGSSNLPELHQRLRRAGMIRIRKEQVLDQLPDKTRTAVPLPLSDPGQYATAEKDFLKWLAANHRNRLRAASRAEELVKVGYLLRLASELKMTAATDWIKDFLAAGNDKLLVFGVHRTVLHGLLHRFKRQAVLVDGLTPPRARKLIFDRFNRDPRVRLFLGNVRAAGAGWSCTSSSTVAFAETGWTPGGVNQCIDRVHGLFRGRPGRGVDTFFLVGRGTIEYKLYQTLQKKMDDLTSVLDGRKGSELAVWNDLRMALLKEAQ